ncbi:MAG: membrane protein insertase YidC [Actinomycetes bacterium]
MGTILNPLYYAVSWVLVTFHSIFGVFTKNQSVRWSLSIIGLVILIRIILIPLFVKQIKSQRAMTALSPKMKEIQKRYKDDRQKQSEEMMKLYKEHKTNPLASCLPIIAQAPIFFALFTVLNGIAHNHPHGLMKGDVLIQASQAKFFGADLSSTFLSSPNTTTKIVTIALILAMSATTFTTQRQLLVKGMPKTDDSNNMMMQQQKIMMYIFPVIFAVSGVNFPVGVLIYWGTTNLWTMGQQFYVIKRNPTPGSPAYDELQKKKDAKGITSPETTLLNEADKDATTATDSGTTEIQGQRQQPKKKKKRKP